MFTPAASGRGGARQDLVQRPRLSAAAGGGDRRPGHISTRRCSSPVPSIIAQRRSRHRRRHPAGSVTSCGTPLAASVAIDAICRFRARFTVGAAGGLPMSMLTAVVTSAAALPASISVGGGDGGGIMTDRRDVCGGRQHRRIGVAGAAASAAGHGVGDGCAAINAHGDHVTGGGTRWQRHQHGHAVGRFGGVDATCRFGHAHCRCCRTGKWAPCPCLPHAGSRCCRLRRSRSRSSLAPLYTGGFSVTPVARGARTPPSRPPFRLRWCPQCAGRARFPVVLRVAVH